MLWKQGAGAQELLVGRAASSSPSRASGLLAARDGAGSAGGGQGQTGAVPAFADHVPAAAGCDQAFLLMAVRTRSQWAFPGQIYTS